MDEITWTFSRAEERLQIRRAPTEGGYLLDITSDGPTRSVFFADLDAAVVFQSDMEAFLLKTGWSFLAFTPDQRSGLDRRDWPRLIERRRWWTDGRHQRADRTDNGHRGKPPR